MSLEFCYALHSGTNDYFYVGRTCDLARRLTEHRRSGNETGTQKERKIAELTAQNKTIEMKMLDCGDASEMMSAEELWKVNLSAQGYELTNERAGDHHPYLGYSFADAKEPTPWSVDDFETAEWVKGDAKAKTNERSTWIKGCQFFRQGKSKLRFWSSVYGVWTVEAAGMEAKYAKVCLMLTQNTPENERLRQQVAQVKRLKP